MIFEGMCAFLDSKPQVLALVAIIITAILSPIASAGPLATSSKTACGMTWVSGSVSATLSSSFLSITATGCPDTNWTSEILAPAQTLSPGVSEGRGLDK